MKKSFLNSKVIISITLLLFAIILAQSILEYRSSRKAVLDLLNNQADALIISVARSGERGILAYESEQEKIRQRLFAIADMIDRLDRFGNAASAELGEIKEQNNLVMLTIYNKGGVAQYSVGTDYPGYGELEANFSKDSTSIEESRKALGFINAPDQRHAFAVALKRSRGGSIVVGIDASELLTLRKTFGAGSVIDEVGSSPGVKYAGILGSGHVLAASRDFPNDLVDDWYHQTTSDYQIETRLRKMPVGRGPDIFEAIGPFTVAGEFYGNIVIGVDTEYLSLLTAKLRRDIFWRSMLFLIVAVTAIGGFLMRQNFKDLSKQYVEIQNDVQRLERDKALSSKLVAMGELASGVAHEIRNPLNAIKVIIQRLEREFKPQADEAEYRELTGVIKKETERINNTIGQFLSFARPPVLHKTISDINDCIREVVNLFEPRARLKNCAVKSSFGNLPVICFDSEFCRQAILNLLENALAAVDTNGLIEISTYRRDSSCCIDISDNGHGIAENEKSRVFDLYFTTKPSGTGVGLPMVLRIVKEHGGRIDLLDSPSGGALFRLEIPLEQ
jgi:signal transduction histidine kinase